MCGPNINRQRGATAGNADPVNLTAANAEMQLSPQERALYQRHLDNLWGPGGVTNPDGSRSTLFNMTTGVDGQTFVLPTVYDGRILPPDQAFDRAKTAGLDSFPSYPTQQAADERYKRLHDFMERDTANYFRARR